jgi:hypothetical protein
VKGGLERHWTFVNDELEVSIDMVVDPLEKAYDRGTTGLAKAFRE